MCKANFYVGIDVSQDELCVAVEGKKPRSFKHNLNGIKAMHEWVSSFSGIGKLHFCMEATGVYSQSLAIRLSAFDQTETSIVNPAQISSYAKAQLRRTKTDGVDASVILSFAQSQKPPVWKPAPEAWQRLYNLVSQLDALSATKRQWSNRAHASSYILGLPDEVQKAQKDILKCLEQQVTKIEKAIKELCAKDQALGEAVQLMTSTKGIGLKSATHLLAYAGQKLTEFSGKALTAHAGLAPHHYQSGTSINGKSRLAKQGDKRLRTALYMPVLSAIRFNPIIKEFYRRLLSQGKPKKLALAACMRKLLLILRAILITKKPFEPSLIHLT